MELPKRKPIRLQGYDYSSNGSYFITICTQNRECILGDDINIVGQGLCPCRIPPIDDPCRLSPIGEIVENEILNIPKRYPTVIIDKYVIMPNHVHMIVVLKRQGQSPCPTICDVVRVIKSISTKIANKNEDTINRKIWQFRFHDHIIRNQEEYLKIMRYIEENPFKWDEDCFYTHM